MSEEQTKYRPQTGFFDITNRPATLTKQEHKKVQQVQMFLMHVQNKAEYFKQYKPIQWQEAKHLSCEIQQIIFQNWSHEELFEEVSHD